MPGASYIAAIQMTTYNRSWTQAGGPGDYVLVSSKLSNGYAYFVNGGTTIGVPVGNIINLSGGFTQINIVAPKDDYIMLYKVATKTTTEFSNPFAAFSSFPSTMTSSGNFVLPNSALPLVNVLVVGSGGVGQHHSAGAGGGNVVKLTAIQAVGTTSVTVGAPTSRDGGRSGDTYFGNVWAMGGGNCGADNAIGGNGGNGAGGANQGANTTTYAGGSGTTFASGGGGHGTAGSPTSHGGFAGGTSIGRNSAGGGGHVGAGGGGAGGIGASRVDSSTGGGVNGGSGVSSDISGSVLYYGNGGGGADHNAASGGTVTNGFNFADGKYTHNGTQVTASLVSYGRGSNSKFNSTDLALSGAVIVRYYIP
jgi:hypothetical protein